MDQTPTEVHPMARKRRVPKSIIKNLIASGQFQVRALDGSEYTDWKQVFDKYEVEPVKNQNGKTTIGHGFYSRNRASIKVDDREFTISQLEHFGDAVVSVSARIICHELFSKRTHYYFLHSSAMITNDNFRTSHDVKNAAQFEIAIGDIFVRYGIEEAVAHGIELLKGTKAYENAVKEAKRLMRDPEASPKPEPASPHVRGSDALDKKPIQNTLADAFPKP